MAARRLSRFWRGHQRFSQGGDAPTSAPTGATQQDSDSPSDIRGIRDATAIETTRPGASPSAGHVDVPVPVSTQGALPTSSGVLNPALTDAQPTSSHGSEDSADVPVLAHAERVPSGSSTSRLPYRLDLAKAQEDIDRISRFRILVVGRANAGKTTILQRVCNTTEQPEIFNGKGERVDPTVVEGRQQRDYHNIEDELVFRSNPGFVFHEGGFGVGNGELFNMMKEFVMDRVNASELDKRIHAIWFCIPLNEKHRMAMTAENRFFNECDTGHVPVIVVLTKADTLACDAIQELMGKGMSLDDAMKQAAEVEKRMADDCCVRVKDLLKECKFPPKNYPSLTGMQADYQPLLTRTTVALKEGLQQFLIQHSSPTSSSPNDSVGIRGHSSSSRK